MVGKIVILYFLDYGSLPDVVLVGSQAAILLRFLLELIQNNACSLISSRNVPLKQFLWQSSICYLSFGFNSDNITVVLG